MNQEKIPDMNCYPYARKKAYFAITIPLGIVLVLVFMYLFTLHPFFALIYAFFWVWINFFQAYCCVYQDCPYARNGEHFCPGVAGIIPASFIARLPIIRNAHKSKKLFDWSATLASLGILGLIIYPLGWLFLYNIFLPVGYLFFILVYAYFFLRIVCPACSIRGTCPGGRFSKSLFGKN